MLKQMNTLPSHASPALPQENPDNAHICFLLGSAYDKAKKYEKAVEEYKQALKIAPVFFEAYVSLGSEYYKLGRYRAAADSYRRALDLRPGEPSLYNKLGAIALILGDYPEALNMLRKAVGLKPEDPTAHFSLGVGYILSGDRDGAIAEYIVLKGLDRERADRLLDLIY